MKTTADYIAAGFEKIDADLTFLMGCLRESLADIGEQDAARSLPWTARATDGTGVGEGIEQAYSIAFQILNMVEELAAARTRRIREIEHGLADEPGCWGSQIAALRAAGLSPAEIVCELRAIRVEPVLTAHPTEAKRPSVLEQQRALHALLARRESDLLTPSEKQSTTRAIRTAFERLWRGGEILLEKPEVASERRGVLHYLVEVFPASLGRLDDRLRAAWEEAGFDEPLPEDPEEWPKVRFGSWVGGDRDGHPLVTADVTQETLEALRAGAIEVLRGMLLQLAANLPLSGHFQKTPGRLEAALSALKEACPEGVDSAARRHPDEPWRQFAILLAERLPGGPESWESIAIRQPSELDAALVDLTLWLEEVGAERIAKDSVWPVRRALGVFGFHLAALDIRQNSRFHDLALSQILKAVGHPDPDFISWPEARRLEFLNAELQSPRPFLFDGLAAGDEARAVLSCYGILREHLGQHGPSGLGSLIVSMTRRLSDLLAVYVLAREVGLARWENGGIACALPVVPLFETLDDLEGSRELMAAFLEHPVTRRTLEAGPHGRVQQAMIGYSDSNKDCGTLASQWALHKAQAGLAEAGQQRATPIRFFHGRGGTISRGAGPTHRFLAALPPGTTTDGIRLTEQGETIAQKYSNLDTATYNLELLLAGVAGLRAPTTGSPPPPAEIWEFLADKSRDTYRELVEHENFLPFYSSATPIDALETSRIGSRPARRTGRRTLADLRAIPWVFSWNQSRFYLPGWFGVGAALRALESEHPDLHRRLHDGVRADPFGYYVLANAETNLASADRDIMTLYAGMVEDSAVRDSVLDPILAEFDASREALAALFGGSLEKRRPRMLKTLRLRADALRILHERQIAVLREWRAARAAESPEAESLLPRVLLSINAIASGLRTTG